MTAGLQSGALLTDSVLQYVFTAFNPPRHPAILCLVRTRERCDMRCLLRWKLECVGRSCNQGRVRFLWERRDYSISCWKDLCNQRVVEDTRVQRVRGSVGGNSQVEGRYCTMEQAGSAIVS